MHELAQENQSPITLLAGLQRQDVSDDAFAASLDELRRLCHTLGMEVASSLSQRRSQPVAATYFGPGKVEEFAEQVKTLRAQHPDRPVYLVVDHDITPWQMRALEEQIDAVVMDRTGVILEIFHRHASSKQARAQVELARLAYLAPRLRESRRGSERQRGGIGGKGAGESSRELDKRRIRDRMAELRQEIAQIHQEQGLRQQKRDDGAQRVAFVGYTNAGKSTLMRALSAREIYVADKLFATLDTTVRALSPPAATPIMVTDTVGFIRNLPHGLVASFQSTLKEALEADLLMHVVDASDPQALAHMAVTQQVLRDIGAHTLPTQLVFNKRDRAPFDQLANLQLLHPDALFVSAQSDEDIARTRAHIIERMEGALREATITLTHDQGALRSALFAQTEVLEETYDELGGTYRVRATEAALAAFKPPRPPRRKVE